MDVENLDARARLDPRWAVALAVAAVSTSALFIRRAEAPALCVAAWRAGLAGLAFLPFGLSGLGGLLCAWPAMTRRERACLLGAGLFLAAHFAAWIESLAWTSVAASMLLVCTTPVWVALASPFVLGERVGRRTWFGIWLALAGIACVSFDAGAWRGNALALCGAVLAAGYFLCGRVARERLDLFAYAGASYSLAGLLLATACLLFDVPLTLEWERARWVLCIVLVPQMIGHTSYNYALRQLGTTRVALVGLLEPFGATLLAWIFLSEVPPPSTWWGAALVVAGVALALSAPPAARKRRALSPTD